MAGVCAAHLEAIDRIRLIESRGSITDDVVLYDAALRTLQTLSEATQRLPEALKEAHPHVPWRQIGAFRNILVHNYLGDIDADSVAAVIHEHLGALAESVGAMLEADSEWPIVGPQIWTTDLDQGSTAAAD